MKNLNIIIACLLISTNVVISQNLGCLMIDFEEIDNDSLFEGKVISDQFLAEFGLTFELESGGSPVLAQVGDPLTAFSSGFGSDTPRPADAPAIGTYFLTDDGDWIDTADPIILNFTTPIDSFAGCILDMDGGEIFYIDAYDEFGGIILQDSIMAGDPNTGDGVATCWGFNLMGCEGTVYQIKFSGFRPGGTFGMGLDNLSFCYSGISVELNVTNPACSGDEDGMIEIISTDGIAYSYSLDGINFTTDGLFTDLEPDLYEVFVMDPSGCMTSYDVSLQSLGSNSSGLIQESLCQGDSVVINAQVYSEPGSYAQFTTNAAGCDSTISIFISELPSFSLTLNESICQGESFVFNGISYSETGEYVQTSQSSEGCDSSVVINLEVIDISIGEITETICSGDEIIINGITYEESGDYEQHLQSAIGCDSLLNIALIVEAANEGQLTEAVCDGNSIQVNQVFYDTAGEYIQNLISVNGCDSILNITVNILPTYEISESYILGAGSSININGTSYSEPGEYEQLLTADNGCDSLILITINPPLIECDDPCVGYIPAQQIETTTQALNNGDEYSIKLKDETSESYYQLLSTQAIMLHQLLDIESELGISTGILQNLHQKEKLVESLSYFVDNESVNSPTSLAAYYTQNYETALSEDEVIQLIERVAKQNKYVLEKINRGGTSKKTIRARNLR